MEKNGWNINQWLFQETGKELKEQNDMLQNDIHANRLEFRAQKV
jgi:hypothetical protein